MDTSQSGHTLAQHSFARPFECQWNFCRLIFPTRDALNHHLLVDHIRRSVPVRRRDIPLLERAEEGLGSSFELTPLLRVPTASASTSSQSKDHQLSGEQFASTSQLPSPPTSSPFVQSMELAECELPRHITPAQLHDHDPSFLSLVSPGSTAPSLQVPPSPSFSTLVRAPMKRKGGPGSPEEPPLKRVRQDDLSQPTSSFDSNASRNIVESQLTQGLESDEDDSEYEPSGREDSGSNSGTSSEEEEQQTAGAARLSRDSQAQIADTPAVTQEKSDLYKAELNWPTSQIEPTQLSQDSSSPPSTQPQIAIKDHDFSSSQDSAPRMPQLPPTSPTATQPQRPLHIHESLSQPPSQLALPTHPPHTEANKPPAPTLQPIQTGANSSMSLPVNSPIALAPPTFAVSTPAKQSWYTYQSPHLQRRSSKTFGGSSGEITPKGSPLQTPTTVSFMQSPLSQVRPQASQASQKSPQKKPTFHSGNLAAARSSLTPKKIKAIVAPSPITPQANAPPANDPPSHPAPTTDLANEATAVALMQQILDIRDESSAVWNESQSQGLPSTQLTDDLERSYPELQTQAPYQSQSFSQLD